MFAVETEHQPVRKLVGDNLLKPPEMVEVT